MNQEPLRAALERLRLELRSVSFRDPAERARLEQLVAGIERQLEGAHDAPQPESLRAGLRASIDQFEVEHPRLTLALNQIISALSSMGI